MKRKTAKKRTMSHVQLRVWHEMNQRLWQIMDELRGIRQKLEETPTAGAGEDPNELRLKQVNEQRDLLAKIQQAKIAAHDLAKEKARDRSRWWPFS